MCPPFGLPCRRTTSDPPRAAPSRLPWSDDDVSHTPTPHARGPGGGASLAATVAGRLPASADHTRRPDVGDHRRQLPERAGLPRRGDAGDWQPACGTPRLTRRGRRRHLDRHVPPPAAPASLGVQGGAWTAPGTSRTAAGGGNARAHAARARRGDVHLRRGHARRERRQRGDAARRSTPRSSRWPARACARTSPTRSSTSCSRTASTTRTRRTTPAGSRAAGCETGYDPTD